MSLTPLELDQLAEVVADRVARMMAVQADPEALTDVHGAAALLACSVPTVERLTKSGDLPSLKVGRLRRYRRADLLERLSGKKGGRDHGE